MPIWSMFNDFAHASALLSMRYAALYRGETRCSASEHETRALGNLVVLDARHVNARTTLVVETLAFVAWAGPDETVGVDYVEDNPSTRRRRRCSR